MRIGHGLKQFMQIFKEVLLKCFLLTIELHNLSYLAPLQKPIIFPYKPFSGKGNYNQYQ